MQQIQYHGIASYKFEYQLSTGGDWTTAVTTPSTATSYAYTIEGLTAGTGYNLRVTVTDNAGNSGTGTKTGTTKKPEKNPGGIINDITTETLITPEQNANCTRKGKSVDYKPRLKNASFDAYLANEKASTSSTITYDPNPRWRMGDLGRRRWIFILSAEKVTH